MQKQKKQLIIPESMIPMYDLGDKNDAFRGILSVGYEEKDIKEYMSSYYYDENEVDSQTYDLINLYIEVFNRALSMVRKTPSDAPMKCALELGAGFGSGTFAMASILTDLRIIATELSVAMLMRHKREGENRFPESEKRIIRCQTNADEKVFKSGCFDIVFGTAILHHVFEPLNLINEVGRILKPNGIAIFCEPFEPGYSLLQIAYEFLLLQDRCKGFPFRRDGLTKKQRNYLKGCINYWNDIRVDAPHERETLSKKDDKWFFPYDYFDKTAKEAGFDTIIKIPISSSTEHHIENKMKVHTEGNNVTLPEKAIEIIKIIDNAFSAQQLFCLPHDGILVLQKAQK